MDLNDLHTRGYSVSTVTGTDAFVTGATRLMKVIANADNAAAILQVYDAVATSGTPIFTLSVAGGTDEGGQAIDFGPNGLAITTGLHAEMANGTAYLIYLTP